MKKSKKIIIEIALLILIIYAIFTIINQQQSLNQYSKNKEDLQEQIKEQVEYKEQLTAKKENVNSLESIEQMAREYLDMGVTSFHLYIQPNEKVYIDQEK